MHETKLFNCIEDQVMELPVIDVHTHLVGGKLGARGLHDILLYHMAVSDLYSAGCPSGARLTQYPGWPSIDEARFRIKEALPYLKYVQGTWISHGVRTILRDLYDFDEPVTQDNWEALDTKIRDRADDKSWQREIISRAKIQRFGTEYARREAYADSDLLQKQIQTSMLSYIEASRPSMIAAIAMLRERL